eukprot:242006-Chlamydomonas_euryale.AAC.3
MVTACIDSQQAGPAVAVPNNECTTMQPACVKRCDGKALADATERRGRYDAVWQRRAGGVKRCGRMGGLMWHKGKGGVKPCCRRGDGVCGTKTRHDSAAVRCRGLVWCARVVQCGAAASCGVPEWCSEVPRPRVVCQNAAAWWVAAQMIAVPQCCSEEARSTDGEQCQIAAVRRLAVQMGNSARVLR